MLFIIRNRIKFVSICDTDFLLHHDNMFLIIVTALFYLPIFTDGIDVEDCGSEFGGINQVTISGCDQTQSSCILNRGDNVSIEVDFTPKTGASAVMIIVHGVKFGMRVSHTMPYPNSCIDPDSGTQCPLTKGESNRYRAAASVPSFCPPISGVFELKLQDEGENDIVCLQFPVAIQ